jgi:hypothetical protein
MVSVYADTSRIMNLSAFHVSGSIYEKLEISLLMKPAGLKTKPAGWVYTFLRR